MTNVTTNIATISEPYLYPESGGACSGIVEDVHTPEMTRMLGQPPMRKPFLVQTIVENMLRGQFDDLPASLSTECQFATRKYFCSTWMLKPEAQNMSYVLQNNNVSGGHVLGVGVNLTTPSDYQLYLPSYPHRDICVQYFDKCGNYLKESFQQSILSTGALQSSNQWRGNLPNWQSSGSASQDSIE
jgi:hypothetical protein